MMVAGEDLWQGGGQTSAAASDTRAAQLRALLVGLEAASDLGLTKLNLVLNSQQLLTQVYAFHPYSLAEMLNLQLARWRLVHGS